MLRAAHVGGGVVRLEYSITLDGELLADIAPTYSIVRRADGVVVASGAFLTLPGGLFEAQASIGAAAPATLSALSSLSYLGLGVQEEAEIRDVEAAVVTIESVDEAVSADIIEDAVEIGMTDAALAVDVFVEAIAVVEIEERIEVVSI